MRIRTFVVVGVAAVVIATIAACSASPDGPPLIGYATDAGSSNSTLGDGACVSVSVKPIADPTTLPACSPSCNAGHCVPSDNVDPFLSQQLAACTGGFCVPDPLIMDPTMVLKTCTSLGGAAGACVSVCVPQVQQYLTLLPQDVCATDEKCAPCTNPLDNTDTHACEIGKQPVSSSCSGSDAGASSEGGTSGGACPYTGPALVDPTMFPACQPACGGSHCVPAALVPAAQQSQLLTCTSAGGAAGYCAPDTLVESGGNGLPPTCVSVAGTEGRCLSECIPLVAAKLEVLPVSTCAATERCAPCYDPTAADPTAPTGACAIACDAPKTGPTTLTCPYTGPDLVDPTIFPACAPACGGAHCVPTALVSTAQQSQLAACDGGFCTPDSLSKTGGNTVPATCTSVAGAEGRCLSECLPLISSKAAALPKDTCGDNELCAPCFDPTSSDPTAPTGACSAVPCDKPAKAPVTLACPYTGPEILDPTKFASCGTAAHCIPTALVPAAQQSQLATCTGGFCTPDKFAEAAGNVLPKTCTSVAGAEGRCLSIVLPAIASQASLLPLDNCDTGEKCAPCYNPTATDPTAPTGACSVACGDMPKNPPLILTCPYTGANVVDPTIFPACAPACGGAHCVPTALVPTAQQAELATCPGGFCAPDSVTAKGGFGVPASCTPFDDPASEGRCTSDCLPAIQAQASQLSQKTCATGELCAPCFDPFTGVSTGACNLACDMPAKPKFTFPTCCTSTDGANTPEGTCVPKSQVPTAQQGSLEANTCPGSSNPANYLCVPNEYLPAPDTKGTVMTCTAAIGGVIPAGAGACVSKCANTSVGGDIFVQGTCGDNHLCIGCSTAAAAGMTVPGCN